MKKLIAGLFVLSFAAGTFAAPPPPSPPPPQPTFAPPPGRHLNPGMTWCHKCEGTGRYSKHWYSFSKPCPKCGGTGMVPMAVPPAPPPPPPPKVAPPHKGPAPKAAPHHNAPAPKPAPHGGPAPKGGHR